MIRKIEDNEPVDNPWFKMNGVRNHLGFARYAYHSEMMGKQIEFHAALDDNPANAEYGVIVHMHGNNGTPYGATNLLNTLRSMVAEMREQYPGIPPMLYLAPNGLDNGEESWSGESMTSAQAWVDKNPEVCEAKSLPPAFCLRPLDSFIRELVPELQESLPLLNSEYWTVFGHSMGGRALHRLACAERFHDFRFGAYIALSGSLGDGPAAATEEVLAGAEIIADNGNPFYDERYLSIFGDSDCGDAEPCYPGAPGNHYDGANAENVEILASLLSHFEETIVAGEGHSAHALVEADKESVADAILFASTGVEVERDYDQAPDFEPASFPGYGAALIVTDPALIEKFYNMVEGE